MILFISHYAGRTGAPIALLHILRWLRHNTDLEFDILLKSSGELKQEFSAIAPTYVCETPQAVRSFLRKQTRPEQTTLLPKAIATREYSLIYSNTVTNGMLIANSFCNSIPLITHCHEMDYWMSKLTEEEMTLSITRTHQFIACSLPSSQCLVKRGASPDRIVVIPEPFVARSSADHQPETINLREQLGIPNDSFVILSGGAEPWRKGKDLFVQLAILLNNSSEQRFDLIWLGERLDDEFEYWLAASAEYANTSGYIHWPGLVSNPQSYFAISHIFCMLSREDPMPLIAIEAGSAGLPVVCFDVAGGAADWVSDSGGGQVVPYLHVGEVANVIHSYSCNRDVLVTDGIRASDYCSQNFSIDHIGPKVYKTITTYLA